MYQLSIRKIALLLALSAAVTGCTKDSNHNQPARKGQVCFYNIKINQCDTINIECEKQTGIVTQQYWPDSATCNADGTFTLTLDTGVHQFRATCGSFKMEKEITVKENECTKYGVGFYTNININGVWTLDLALESDGSNCDETLLEDEAHIPPTLHFLANGQIQFDTDPVGSDLNGAYFDNGYDLSGNNLKIWCSYKDGVDTIHFQCNLVYDSRTQRFTGTYTNQWTNGTICTNTVTLYKE